MGTIKVRCPKCGARYSVAESALGKKTTCKKSGCGQSFRLTAASEEPKPAAAKAPAPADGRPRGEDGVPVIWEPGDVILNLYEVTGVLGDSLEELVDAVGRVGACSPEACRSRVDERFSARAMVDGYERIFASVASGGSGSGFPLRR